MNEATTRHPTQATSRSCRTKSPLGADRSRFSADRSHLPQWTEPSSPVDEVATAVASSSPRGSFGSHTATPSPLNEATAMSPLSRSSFSSPVAKFLRHPRARLLCHPRTKCLCRPEGSFLVTPGEASLSPRAKPLCRPERSLFVTRRSLFVAPSEAEGSALPLARRRPGPSPLPANRYQPASSVVL